MIHADCGNDFDAALDPKTLWMVDHTTVCQACATRDMVRRQLEQKHENDKPSPGVPDWADGRIITVRPASKADLRGAETGRLEQMSRH